jgi:hypothetical protein
LRAPWSPAWQPSVSGPLVCDRPFRRIFGVPATASRVEVTHDCHLRSCYCCCCHVRRRLSSHRCQQVWPWCQPNLPPSCAPRSARKRVPPHPSFRPPRHVRESPLPRADESNEKTGLWRRRRPTFLQCWTASVIAKSSKRDRSSISPGSEAQSLARTCFVISANKFASTHIRSLEDPLRKVALAIAVAALSRGGARAQYS